ncbi:MAG: alpha/beta fold hydrolase [Limnochordales bacterium]|nr:alpha/beta fold hydrolase [Limnochordales bacterium]
MLRSRGALGRPLVYRRRKNRLGRLLLAAVLLAAMGAVGVSVYVGWSLSHPAARPVDRTPAELGLDYEAVAFPAPDGLTLRGWYLPAADSPYTIIMAHGYTSNRLQPSLPGLELARSLVAAGFNVLMFDFRNHGESEGHVTTLGYREAQDIHGAVEWLKGQRAQQAQGIGLIGFSMGAATAILAAADEPRIAAVVADSPFSDLRAYLTDNMPVWTGLPPVPFTWLIMTLLPPLIGLDTDAVSPLAAVPRLPQPLLLIHTDGDDVIPARESQRLAAAGHPDRTQLWLASGPGHVGARRADPAAYDARVIDFFRTHLGQP